MSGGLVALLDDVAVLARAAAASLDDVGAAAARAGVKAAGVVVDDTAVSPQYVRGLSADRELPIIRRIAPGCGSLPWCGTRAPPGRHRWRTTGRTLP